jgi:S1-C subfamily serine protease
VKRAAISFPSVILSLTFVLIGGVAAQTKQPQPSLRETLRWMQTSLETGAGDYSVHHEVRSVRLEDFVGCKVHFSYSDHQVPYLNGEPAPEPNKTFHMDYFFGLGDIDPADINFSKGAGLHADDAGLYETPSLLTIRTRNDEKKITIRLPWQSEADSKPDDTSLIFSLDSIDSDYVVRFAKAFKHAVEACGGKPSFFADSDGRDKQQQSPRAPAGGAQSAPPRKDIPAIAKAANGAIVTIVMANGDKLIAQGTGFLVSADGAIVTNYHVIATGNVAIVKFPDGTAFPVDGVLAADKVRDLAIIKIHGKTFRTLALGDSDRVQVGEEVVAIGNPLSLESTVSNGIISGVRTSKEKGGKFLQTTAPITHGSSGGPLFNIMGEVIGITTLGFEGAGNLNFAIPVNDAKQLLLINDAKRLLLNQYGSLSNLPNEPEEADRKSAAPPVAPKVAPSNEGVYSANLFGGRYSIKVSGDEMRIITLRGADWFDESVKDTLLKTEFSWNHNVVLYEKDGSYWYHELTFGFNRPNKKNGDFVYPCYFKATLVLQVESESRISGAIELPADVNLASCVASRTVTVPITFTSK